MVTVENEGPNQDSFSFLTKALRFVHEKRIHTRPKISYSAFKGFHFANENDRSFALLDNDIEHLWSNCLYPQFLTVFSRLKVNNLYVSSLAYKSTLTKFLNQLVLQQNLLQEFNQLLYIS